MIPAALLLLLAAACAGVALLARADLRTLLAVLDGGAGHTRLPGFGRVLDAILRQRREQDMEAARLRRARDAEAVVMEYLPDPVVVLDRSRAVLRANPAARLAFGADLAAVLRQPALAEAVSRAATGLQPEAAELSVAAPVAREVVATVVAPPALEGALVAVLSDRTRDRAVERMRADFVANASHELRTPLASLIGFIDTLRGPARDDPDARDRFLLIMAAQAGRMNRLIDDLLSLSRIELVEHQPPSGSVDLPALLHREAAVLEPLARSRPATLHVDAIPGLFSMPGDPDQVTQVVHNLVENALKYGREGGRVHVTAIPAPADGRWPAAPGVLLTVSDQGPGIARSDLPRLTERFYRTDKARSRAAGGTGLGLAIVKHIVNRHRGRLLIESEEGVGTTVNVWWPR